MQNSVVRRMLEGLCLLAFLLAGCSSSRPFTVAFQGGGTDRGVGLTNTTDGGFLVSGVTSSGEADGQDGLLLRTDASGRLLWTALLGSAGDDASWQTVETELGFTTIGFTTTSDRSADCLMSRVSKDGEIEWSRHLAGEARERCWSLTAVGDDGFAIAGEIVSEDEQVHDCLLIRTGPDGDVRWKRTYDKGLQERCFAIAPRNESGLLLVGQTTADGGEERDVYLIGTDSEGGIEFEHVIGDRGIDVGHGVTTVRGGVVVAGYTAGFGAKEVDPLLLKLGHDGTIEWRRTIEVEGHARGLTVDAAEDGTLCVGGFRRTADGETRPFVIRHDVDGTTRWIRDFDSFTIGYTAVAADGGCVLTGHGSGGPGDDADAFLAKVTGSGESAPGVSIIDINPEAAAEE